MIVGESGDALHRHPEIVPRNVAVPAGPAVAAKGLRVPISLADEQPGSQRGLVIHLVEASSEEPLSLPLR
jgi:hypothetical protein